TAHPPVSRGDPAPAGVRCGDTHWHSCAGPPVASAAAGWPHAADCPLRSDRRAALDGRAPRWPPRLTSLVSVLVLCPPPAPDAHQTANLSAHPPDTHNTPAVRSACRNQTLIPGPARPCSVATDHSADTAGARPHSPDHRPQSAPPFAGASSAALPR